MFYAVLDFVSKSKNGFCFIDNHFLTDNTFFDVPLRRNRTSLRACIFQNGTKPRAPDFLSIDNFATLRSAPSVNFRITFSSSNSFLYCLMMRPGLHQNAHQDLHPDHPAWQSPQPSDKFRYKTEFQKIFGPDFRQHFSNPFFLFAFYSAPNPMEFVPIRWKRSFPDH